MKEVAYGLGAGIGAGFVGLTAPIHEACHVAASKLIGGGGYIHSWRMAAGLKRTPFVMFAGYAGEAIAILALAYLLRRKRPAPAVMYGMLLTLLVEWPGSYDQAWLLKDGSPLAHAFVPFAAVGLVVTIVVVAMAQRAETQTVKP